MYSPEWEKQLDSLPQGIFFNAFVAAFVAVALFFALLYGDWATALFTLILLLLALGLRIWRRLAARALKFTIFLDKARVFPGEKIDFQVRAANRKFLPVFVKILLSFPASLTRETKDPKDDTGTGALLWFQEMAFHRDLIPQSRGVYAGGSVRLITGDYFGFFPKALGEAEAPDILVYPPLVPVKELSVLTPMLFGKKAKSSAIYDPIHVLGTRDYRGQSPARNIHWKASARHHRLQEKIYDMTEAENVLILFEADGFVSTGDRKAFEHALSVIGSLALTLSRSHYKLGFVTNCVLKGEASAILIWKKDAGFLSQLFETLARIDFRAVCPVDRLFENENAAFNRESCLYFSYEPTQLPWVTDNGNVSLVNIFSCDSEAASLAVDARFQIRSIKDICQVN